MAVTTFAAIDIGSYEISMKIFEFSKKIGFRELNDVRYRLEIGKGAYSRGRLEPEMVDDICVILKDFSNMMHLLVCDRYNFCHALFFLPGKDLFHMEHAVVPAGFPVRQTPWLLV